MNQAILEIMTSPFKKITKSLISIKEENSFKFLIIYLFSSLTYTLLANKSLEMLDPVTNTIIASIISVFLSFFLLQSFSFYENGVKSFKMYFSYKIYYSLMIYTVISLFVLLVFPFEIMKIGNEAIELNHELIQQNQTEYQIRIFIFLALIPITFVTVLSSFCIYINSKIGLFRSIANGFVMNFRIKNFLTYILILSSYVGLLMLMEITNMSDVISFPYIITLINATFMFLLTKTIYDNFKESKEKELEKNENFIIY